MTCQGRRLRHVAMRPMMMTRTSHSTHLGVIRPKMRMERPVVVLMGLKVAEVAEIVKAAAQAMVAARAEDAKAAGKPKASRQFASTLIAVTRWNKDCGACSVTFGSSPQHQSSWQR